MPRGGQLRSFGYDLNSMEILFYLVVALAIVALFRFAIRHDPRGRFSADILDTSSWSLDLLRALEWKRFETVCAGYFEALGFTARTARAGADGGVDIHLYSRGATKPGIVVQCKAWNTYKVGIKPIRELYGVMSMEGIPKGIFVTTARFTNEARAFPKADQLLLWDGERLLSEILKLPEDRRTSLLRAATSGDFTTPTCPSCAIKMTMRTSRKDGQNFWGCKNYPRCRQTFRISRSRD